MERGELEELLNGSCAGTVWTLEAERGKSFPLFVKSREHVWLRGVVSRNVSRRRRHGKEMNLWFIITEQQLSWSQKILQRFNMKSKFYFRVHIAVSLQWQKWFNWIIELKLVIIQFFLVVWWMNWYWSLEISLLLAKKESLFCSRVHAWEGLDIVSWLLLLQL